MIACGGDGGDNALSCDEDCFGVQPSVCADGTLTSFQAIGECENGVCVFPVASQEPCAHGCADETSCRNDVTDDHCDGVVCDTPPSARCEGDVRTGFASEGTCDEETGTCAYAELSTDCAAEGRVCANGQCVTSIACADVTCDDPPAPRCDGDVAVRAEELGTCDPEDGSCSYATSMDDCGARGEICRGGVCQSVDACGGDDCTQVPAPRCDNQVAVSFTGARCDVETDLCVRDERRDDCAARGQVCVDGACARSTACDAVVCDARPSPRCDGGVAVRFDVGTCQLASGACDYPETQEDCALRDEVCREGQCVAETCVGVVCASPPAPRCDENGDVVTSGAGACVDDGCVYAETVASCDEDETCLGGACIAVDPCDAVTSCDTPPAATCDGADAVTMIGPGVCTDGACVYSEFRTRCADIGRVCVDGACAGPCDGVVCDAPPGPACSGDVAVIFNDTGACNTTTGDCVYGNTPVNCQLDGQLCQDGACVDDPCETTVCDTPPAAICDGNLSVEYLSSATCERGVCTYAQRTRDCAVLGQTCIDGGCRDACFGIACDTPPAPLCVGDTLATYGAEGVCNPATGGGCTYPVELENCGTDGGVCRQGACRASPCDGVACTTPPPATCEGSVHITYADAGVCFDGLCSYARVTDDCSARGELCADDGCVGLCEGVTCEPPPVPRCVGAVLVTSAPGVCSPVDGRCTFATETQNCTASGEVCREGACVPPPCTGVVCDAPPAPVCDGDLLRTAFGAGTCDESTGECGYAVRIDDCTQDEGRCVDGVCVSRCFDVMCDAPPADNCVGDVSLSYPEEGVCRELDGACLYPPASVDCATTGQVCRNGACVDPPCDGVVCDEPPPSVCQDNVLRIYTPVGACQPFDGSCVYGSRFEDCTIDGGVCAEGRCVGPCEGVACTSPPADACIGDVARTFAPEGVCVGASAVCTYEATSTDCTLSAQRCLGGACVDSLCDGVECTTPIAPFCDGDERVEPTGPGACNEASGECSFATVREDCSVDGGRCLDGVCVDRCEGVVCDAPPADICAGSVATIHPETGVCSLADGTCLYLPDLVNCTEEGQVCREGACVPPPCQGVSCNDPPPAFCDGEILQTPFGAGVCEEEDGTCTYARAFTDCSVDGGSCRDGRCVGICEEVICDDPPQDTCDGETAFIFGDGVCNVNDGTCLYPPTTINCGLDDLVCVDAACVLNPCDDPTRCEDAPAPHCDGDEAVTPVAPGLCIAPTGVCAFSENRVDCAAQDEACFDGACVGLCGGVVCDTVPEPFCDGEVLVALSGPGACNPSTGLCDFVPSIEDCTLTDQLCRDGACVPNPCVGVTCNDPPSAFCDGDDLVVAVAATGVCDDATGACSYASLRQACADSEAVCLDGACVGACDTISCEDPPADFCSGNVAVRYPAEGSCTGDAICAYPPTTQACPVNTTVCEAGQCVLVDVCEEVGCDEPPPPYCIGQVHIISTLPGFCEDGTCIFVEDVEDCAVEGEFCIAGVGCVADDPCAALSCDDPFPPACMEDILMSYVWLGGCVGSQCSYELQTEDCTETPGFFCRNGRCTDEEPCDGVVCNAPPPAVCRGNLVEVYGDGICNVETEACFYPSSTVDCTTAGQYCVGGACVDDDPCVDVACVSPPAPFCEDGTVRVTGANPGDCFGGACVYDRETFDCASEGRLCDSGACVDGPCAEVTCPDFRGPECDSGTISVTYIPPAICDVTTGECTYDVVYEDCSVFDGACIDGACATIEPCDGVSCPALAPVCEDNVAVTRVAGTCSGGLCTYTRLTDDCGAEGGFCVDGACQSVDPCDVVVCDDPPGPVCVGNTAITYLEDDALCTGGSCIYRSDEQPCGLTDQFCAGGVCVDDDPCQDVVCEAAPGDTCIGELEVRWAAQGTCAAGACSYESTTRDCAALGATCSDGRCSGAALCDDLACDLIGPPPFCDEDVAVSYPPALSTCEDGECFYAETTLDCVAIDQRCYEGACVDPVDTIEENELLITELLLDAVEPARPFIEIRNVTSRTLDVTGLEIVVDEDGDPIVVDTSTALAPGSFLLIAVTGGPPADLADVVVAPAVLDFDLSSVFEIVVRNGRIDISRVRLDATWSLGPGVAIQLDPASLFPASRESWCAATEAFASGNVGTPGSENASCP